VTAGPGLIGCLLLGVEAAKSLAALHGKPLIAVNHLAAHLYSPMMPVEGRLLFGDGEFAYPHGGLLVSGGHSELVLCHGPLAWEPMGQTLDDAAGEAYDKVAKLLGLGYPGGPVIDERAALGNPEAIDFPRPMRERPGFDLSFSGLKTAVRVKIEELGGPEAAAADEALLNDLCASFQAAVIDSLLTRTKRAMKAHHIDRLSIAGGVAANRGLRAETQRRFPSASIAIPPMSLCTDNAAMIGGLAWHQLLAGDTAGFAAAARPQWPLSEGEVSLRK
jgi:N6-L-threonylcarbamoyladenine synthase